MQNPHDGLSSQSRKLWKTILLTASMALLLAGSAPSYGQITITEINPDQSTLDASDPDGATGGRVNGLASVAGNNRIFYAASEWGGIYRSTDAGRSWGRLNNHLPTATWDIEVNPANANRLYATSFYDGRVNSLAGINVSTDGGNTWTHPTTATPPVGFCAGAARRDEPLAFGISVNPANPQNVFIGTNCGLAISNNGGTSWQYVDPTPANPADDIWDVVVHHNGIIDLCGNDGHRRSTDGGTTWTTATGTALPSGICSLTASPDESYVLFAVAGTSIFESDDGGANWSTQFVNPSAQGRIPFVVTNQRSGAAFDLWFGDISLWRANCTTPAMPAPGGAARCPASNTWAGPFTRAAGGHDDTGDIVFDTGAANDACPALFSSDGGVYFNTLTTSPACHTPVWEQPNVTPHGLWLFGMAGADRAGQNNEDLYFGCQDNGTFATLNAGVNSPPWANRNCCDGFDDVADPTRVIYSLCCFGPPANRLFISKPGMVGTVQINNTPPGIIPGFTAPDIIDQFGPNSYILLTTSGLFITTNVTAIPIVWTQLGAATSPAGACGVQAAAATAGTPTTFYVQAGFCSGSQPDTLWRFTGTAAGGSWQLVNPPGGVGGFGIFAVDPGNPNRLFASHLRPTGPQMILSTDGGATWVNNAALDNLMTGGGLFRYSNQRGPTSFTGFNGYVQPALVAYDPVDQNTLLAGGADSGIFLSTNGGVNWTVVTNNSGSSTNPHIPRPQFAYFDHEGLKNDIYIGTQGRGLWRLSRGSTRIRDDLFLYRPGNGAAWVARSNGDGTFTGVYTVGDNGPASPNGIAGYDLLSSNDQVLPFDYNSDGRYDLFLYRPGSGAAWVARSNGDGTFTGVYTVGDNGSAPPNGIAGYDLLSSGDRVLVFDYNKDGKDDLFLYRPGSGAAWVARSNGDGTFTGVYTVGDNGSAPPNGIAGYDLLSPADRVLALDYNK